MRMTAAEGEKSAVVKEEERFHKDGQREISTPENRGSDRVTDYL